MKTKKKKRIIGPFLGPRGTKGISICIGLPDYEEEQLICKIDGQDEKCATPKYNSFKLFQFDFPELEEGKEYSYKFLKTNGEDLDLGNLTQKDCHFKVLGDDTKGSFVFLSCNNPFKKEKGSADDGWTMWERLNSFLKEDNSVRLILLGGDQVYNDDIEKKHKKKSLEEKVLINKFISQYEKYWGNENYRKIFASIPSLAMWDDHDITDGWGSRKELQNKKKWNNFFKVAKEAFEAYQTSRNYKKIKGIPNNVFTSSLCWGSNMFILCDFRSERDSQNRILWSKQHKEAVLSFIKNSPEEIKKIFFLSPVVPFRTNFKGDRRLSKGFLYFLKFRKFIKKNKYSCIVSSFKQWVCWTSVMVFCLFIAPMIASFMILLCSNSNLCTIKLLGNGHVFFDATLPSWGKYILIYLIISFILKFVSETKALPDLSDDIEDGLSSDSNMDSLKEILEVLTEIIKKKGKEVFILSGDIHLGGLTEIIDTREGSEASILQVVSSPIAYKPMPKLVEGLTTTTSEMVIRECTDKERLLSRNIFYISKRNFVQIIPNKLNEDKGIKFILEGHQTPLIFPKKFF